jgi:zinc and cadmium transporter
MREEALDKVLFYFVSFASGAILGAAYFDLIPEALEMVEVENAIIYVASGFVFFYLLERTVYWYHGHGHIRNGGKLDVSWEDERTGIKSYTYLNLLGDMIHNLIDGMVIGASFLISITAGIVTTLAVAFHELPQEIGDFAILVYGGFKKMKALALNFLSALTAIAGVIIVYLVLPSVEFVGSIVGFVGGGFIYISAAELIPELQKEKKMIKSVFQFILFILALFFIWFLVTFIGE